MTKNKKANDRMQLKQLLLGMFWLWCELELQD